MEYDYFEDYESAENREILHCFCYGHCQYDEGPGICEVAIGGKCFASVALEVDADGSETPVNSFGCLSQQMADLQCKGSLVPHLRSKSIQCCDDTDLCNKHLYPSYTFDEYISITRGIPFIICMSSLGACIVSLLFLLIYCRKFRRKQISDVEQNQSTASEPQSNAVQGQISFELSNCSTGSARSNLMNVRTISKQLEMVSSICQGQFGEVWLAKWRGEKVAVKIFFEEEIWLREIDIYQTVLMRQENILGFIAADLNFTDQKPQMLLITEYHELGTLSDYLSNHILTPNALLLATKSIARGLAHLHMEILGVPGKGKPSVIHRNFTSKNILMKANGECCIADFGRAAKYDSKTNIMDFPVKEKHYGTMRYLAPEILNKTIDKQSCDSFKMVDIYAFGLILWEMSRRCTIDEVYAEEYMLPYQDLLPEEPTMEQMTLLVCTQKTRPHIPDSFSKNPVLKVMHKLIQEMWHENSAARLTALRIKKTLNILSSQERDSQ